MIKLLGHAEDHLKPERVHGTKMFVNHCVRQIQMKLLNWQLSAATVVDKPGWHVIIHC